MKKPGAGWKTQSGRKSRSYSANIKPVPPRVRTAAKHGGAASSVAPPIENLPEKRKARDRLGKSRGLKGGY